MPKVKTKTSEQKLTFVCFVCRAVFKKPAIPYWEENIAASTSLHNCTFCHKKLAFLGRYFHAPAKNDVREWRKIELLWEKGWTADGYSLSPRTLADAKNYSSELQRRKKKLRLDQVRRQSEEHWSAIRIKRQHLKRHAP